MDTREDVLRTTLDIEHNGITYTFAIPGFTDEIKLGMRERAIRREYDPESNGSPYGLDNVTYELCNGAAAFETLLRSCTNAWPYSKDKDGKPVVDHHKFPDDRIEEVAEVGIKFQAAVVEFRKKRNSDRPPGSTEAVAGVADPTSVAVQP